MIAGLIRLLAKIIWNAVVAFVCASLVFIGFKGNQPMAVAGVPKEMTYFEFIQDRLDAAKYVKPSQCGWGMILSLAVLGPAYSVIYTYVAIHPGGIFDKVTAPDQIFPPASRERSGMKFRASGGMS